MIRRLRNNAFVWNSLILFSGTMLVNVLNYLFHLVVGRMVIAEVYGEIESLISLLTIVSVPAAAIGLIATKYGAQTKASNDPHGSHIVFRYLNRQILIFGVPLLAIAFALTPVVGDFLRIESSVPIFFLWILMFLSFLGAVSNGLLSGWQKFGSVNKAGIWGAFVKVVLGITLIHFGFLVNGAVGSFLAAGVVSYGVSLLCLRFIFNSKASSDREASIPSIDTSTIKHSVLPTFVGILAITLLGNADVVFAKHALEPSLSGEYSALAVVAKTIFFVTGVIASVLFAMTAGEGQKSGASLRTFGQAAALTFLIGFGSVMFFSLFPKFVLGVFFGEKYLGAERFLVWFALAAALHSLANLSLQYLLSIHRARTMRWFLVVAILEIFLLYFYGKSLYGIITVTVSAQLVALFAGFFSVFRRFKRFSIETV